MSEGEKSVLYGVWLIAMAVIGMWMWVLPWLGTHVMLVRCF
jgi:hypothetical protein